MSEAFVERGKIDIGRVLQETFGVIGRNIATFSILGLVLSAIPLAIVSFVQVSTLRGIDFDNPSSVLSSGYLTNMGSSGLAGLITSAILQGALIYATVQDLNGQKASLADCFATGLRNFLPLIIVSILWALGIGFAFVLLIVPGIILLCIWCVAFPALVADRTGIFGAFSRSAELTRGNRWRIFALGVVLVVFSLVVSSIFNVVLGVNAFSGDVGNIIERATSPLFIILTVIRGLITSVIGSTLVAVLYIELRRAREGAGPEWLADIFA